MTKKAQDAVNTTKIPHRQDERACKLIKTLSANLANRPH